MTLQSRFQVKKVAVLGAGVMGAQIAAHLVNLAWNGMANLKPEPRLVTEHIDRRSAR